MFLKSKLLTDKIFNKIINKKRKEEGRGYKKLKINRKKI